MTKEIISENLKYYRKIAGLTQGQLAGLLTGVTQSQIGSYEEKRAMPRVPVLQQIAEVLGVEFDDMISKRKAKKAGSSHKDQLYHRYRKLSLEKRKIIDYILNN